MADVTRPSAAGRGRDAVSAGLSVVPRQRRDARDRHGTDVTHRGQFHEKRAGPGRRAVELYNGVRVRSGQRAIHGSTLWLGSLS